MIARLNDMAPGILGFPAAGEIEREASPHALVGHRYATGCITPAG
jgi:hypothetical protein